MSTNEAQRAEMLDVLRGVIAAGNTAEAIVLLFKAVDEETDRLSAAIDEQDALIRQIVREEVAAAQNAPTALAAVLSDRIEDLAWDRGARSAGAAARLNGSLADPSTSQGDGADCE